MAAKSKIENSITSLLDPLDIPLINQSQVLVNLAGSMRERGSLLEEVLKLVRPCSLSSSAESKLANSDCCETVGKSEE